MSLFVPLALFGWIPAVLLIFALLPPRRAVLAAFLLAWLFLPMAGYAIAGLPDYNKMSAASAGVLLATLVFDPGRLLAFRVHWFDLPMTVWCLVPLASSLSNGLGLYDGLSAILNRTVPWGLPYLIGRLYFRDGPAIRELAAGLFIGGLLYVPLCLYEIRMSPQLHTMLYGFHQHSFDQTHRFGGWRPTVFMQHGLMVAMWMCVTAVVGVWLWYAGGLPRRTRRAAGWGAIALTGTALLCKSAGATLLMVAGLTILFVARKLRRSFPPLLFAVAPLVYMAARGAGLWDGAELLSAARGMSSERADSLAVRLFSEDRLVAKAWQRPLFGWGGWGRGFVDELAPDSERVAIPEAFWVIALATNGLAGLGAATAALLLPAWCTLRRAPVGQWGGPELAAPVVLSVLLIMYVIDNLFNAMLNPIFTLCAGGLTSFTIVNAVQVPRLVSSARARCTAALPRPG